MVGGEGTDACGTKGEGRGAREVMEVWVGEGLWYFSWGGGEVRARGA